MHNFSDHQKKQIQIINKLEKQIKSGDLGVSTVSPTTNFETDDRIFFAGVYFPSQEFVEKIQNELVKPLKEIDKNQYYYPPSSIHITIKNIRTISDPPNFNESDIEKAKVVFSKVTQKHKGFNAYFYKLIIFPNNLTLVGTTDSEFDDLLLDLDSSLKNAGIADDKTYANSKYFFSNITLCRFYKKPSSDFIKKVSELNNNFVVLEIPIKNVELVSANAVLKKRAVYGKWNLND